MRKNLNASARHAVDDRMRRILKEVWIELEPGKTVRCDTKRHIRDQIERVMKKPKGAA